MSSIRSTRNGPSCMKMDIMIPTTSGVQQCPPLCAGLVGTDDMPSRRGAFVAVNTIVNCSRLHDQMLSITLHRSRLYFTCAFTTSESFVESRSVVCVSYKYCTVLVRSHMLVRVYGRKQKSDTSSSSSFIF